MASGTQDAVAEYSSSYVRLLFDYLQAKGLNAKRVLGEPPPAPNDNGLTRYTSAHWRRLLKKAAEALDDPLLGLHLGRTITPAHLGVLGYVLLACPDVGGALSRWLQLEALVCSVSSALRREGDSVRVVWSKSAKRLGSLVDETALAAYVQFARNISGRDESPQEVCFRNPRPADLRPYRQFFRCPVRFDQPTTSIRFASKFLERPLRQPDATLLGIVERQAQMLLGELPRSGDLERSVRQALMQISRVGEMNIRDVAGRMSLSPRSLQRRLAEARCSFRDLREDTLRRLAFEYVADPRLTFAEIAWLLGYSEPSAFSRSFQRWAGQSPRDFRQAAVEWALRK